MNPWNSAQAYVAKAETEWNNDGRRNGSCAPCFSHMTETSTAMIPITMGAIVWALLHANWMPAHDMPIRKLVMPPMKKKPPTQSTRDSLDINDDLDVVSLT